MTAAKKRKAIVFSIIYAAIFLSMFYMTSFFANTALKDEKSVSGLKESDKASAILDDLSSDFEPLLQFNVSAAKAGGNTVLEFNDSLPAAYSLAGNLTAYEEFINWTGNYSKQLNYNVSVNYAAFRASPRVFVESRDPRLGLNYSWQDLNKNQVTIAATTQVAAGVELTLGTTVDTCNTTDGWSSGTMPAAIVLKNPDGSTACGVGTPVNPASENIVWANTTAGGWLTVSIGTVGGTANSTKIVLNSVAAFAKTNHTLAGLSSFAVRAPVSANLSTGEVYSPSLVILRK